MKRMREPAAGPAREALRLATWLGLGVLLTALWVGTALAQEADRRPFDLVGVVTDESGRPLVGAFVAMGDSEWGSLTSETGRFVLPRVTPGPVMLRVELIGYETLLWSGDVAEGSAPALTLTPKALILEGLTVVTDRFQSRRRAVASSVRWYDHDDLATSTLHSALDFVAVRAGLFRVRCSGAFTNECFMVRGRPVEPRVYVDEVPVFGGTEYLASMRPHELYMVEVFGNGRHIRAYTPQFMERAAKDRIRPIPVIW